MTIFGLDTFGDITVDDSGAKVPAAQVIRNVAAQAVLADQVGVDAFGIGEHHRDDYAVSAPDIVLADISGRTEKIVLGTAVTVLSSDDPIRVFQRFTTLNALSGGRAEITLGRGSFTESFPLFGLDLGDYEKLFSEKLDIFAALHRGGPVSWQGTVRPPLIDVTVHPVPERTLPVWIGVGGSPESVVRAARYGFNLMLAIIGGEPERFVPYADLYRRAVAQFGTDPLPIGVHSPGFIADTDDLASEQLFPHFKANRDRIGRDRGWPPATRDDFDNEVEFGSLYVGSPETVATKIAATVKALGLDRFDLKYSSGTMPHAQLMHCIELYGAVVIPRVRELLAAD